MNEKNVLADAATFCKMHNLGEMSFKTYDPRNFIITVNIEKYEPEETEEEDE